MDQTTVNWIVGIAATGAIGLFGMFVKGVLTKVENSVSRTEFLAALEALRSEHQNDRKELRDNQVSIFNKLEVQNHILTKVETKMDMLTSMRPFDKTYPGGSK